MIKSKVEREINRINRFEKKWKIKTSHDKFKIIPIAQHTKNIVVNGEELNTNKEGKLLGLKVQSTGIVGHVSTLKNKANAVVTKLRRFTDLTQNIKTTLVKTLLIPILEYPPVPLSAVLLTQKINLESVLNKALRFVHHNEQDILRSEDLHLKYNITPLNISIHNKACKIWDIVHITEHELYNNLTIQYRNKHTWFPKTGGIINSPLPAAIYTREHHASAH